MGYRIFNLDEKTYDYEVIIEHEHKDGIRFTLVRTDYGNWSEEYHNTEALSLINTGNGIIFPKKKYTGETDYTNTVELLILLNFINKMDSLPLYNGRVEEIMLTKRFPI